MVAHVCNFSTSRLRQEDCALKASQGSIARPCLKEDKNAGNTLILSPKGIPTLC
jgi:hypothetical protein